MIRRQRLLARLHEKGNFTAPAVQCVETRMKPCLDGVKTESGTETAFNVPSPAMVELVCQSPATRFVRYRMLWLKPDCDWNWNWKFTPLFCGFSNKAGEGPPATRHLELGGVLGSSPTSCSDRPGAVRPAPSMGGHRAL